MFYTVKHVLWVVSILAFKIHLFHYEKNQSKVMKMLYEQVKITFVIECYIFRILLYAILKDFILQIV